MAQVERPLSPHLQVYRLPLTAVLSILHRITGVGLGLGTLMLTWWLVAAASGPEAYGHFQWFAGSILGLLILFGFTLALSLHLLNGIRHLFWDAGWGFDKVLAHKASLAVAAGAVGLTVIIWIAALI
ncbi:succinate dehydrogenase, cytochrome b556 subunit [Zavarzinia sp.]|uniref:succinate dehydrogenase, cytochrome b556 subunit n=1 Tax=Zavarzinia sp. TaxID=2027920 RepID=UPI003566E858